MNYEILSTDINEGIATLTISRPKAMNALNRQFFAEMNGWLSEFGGRRDIKVLIITGAGNAFVAGADIAELKDMDPVQGKEISAIGQQTFARLEQLDMPVIAAVNGFALGGGCELALACDIRIASNKAKFGQPEVNLGLIPGFAGTQRLPRLIGLGNALYLLISGDLISADEALRLGLVQKVVAPEQLLTEALELARKITAKGPAAVRLVKKVCRQGLELDFKAGCLLETSEFSSLFGNEGLEGMSAFLEKRPAKW